MNFEIKTAIVGIAIVMFLCLISSASALTSKDFTIDEEKATDLTAYGKVTLSDRFFLDILGWFETPIQELTLTDNTEVCSGGSCYAIIDITLHEKGKIVDSVKFDNIREDGSRTEGHPFSYQFYINDTTPSRWKEVEVNDYSYICKDGDVEINGSVSQICSNEIVGTHKEVQYVPESYEVDDYGYVCEGEGEEENCVQVKTGTHLEYTTQWKPYNYEEVEAGDYVLKLEGTIPYGKTYDWIITSQGKEIEEWAVWASTNDVFKTGLIAYWDFDENTGSSLTDKYRGKHNGTLIELPSWTTGKLGSALEFNGTNYVNVPINNDFLGVNNNTLTIAGWVWHDASQSNYPTIVSQYKSAGGLGYLLSTTAGTNDLGFFSNGGGWDDSNDDIDIGKWVFVAVSINGGESILYINATNVGSFSGVSWGLGTYFGIAGAESNDKWDGKIDELGIWNRSLSSTEISTLYNSGVGITYTGSDGVVLDSPANNYVSNILTQTFNASISHTTTITNASLWINGVLNQTNDYVNDGLVAYYKLNDNADTTTIVDSAGSNNGVMYGSDNNYTSEFDTTGKVNGAIQFDGVNDYVRINISSLNLQNGTNMSFSIWFQDTYKPSQHLFSIHNDTTILGEFRRGFGTPASLFWCPYNRTSSNCIIGTNLYDFDYKWHNAVTITDGSMFNLYLDGVFVRTSYAGSDSRMVDQKYSTLIISSITPSSSFNGSLDDVRIYNRTLSQTEITQLYEMGQKEIESRATSIVDNWTRTFSVGFYNWTIQACDIDGDCGWAFPNRSLTIDNVAPTVSVSYGNGTFNYGSLTTNHTINYTATDSIAGLSRCWLDYNAVNTTIPCTSGSVNTTNFQLVQDVYRAIVWANDTAGNKGSYAFNWSYAFFGGTSVYEVNVSETNSSRFSFQIDSAANILFQYGLLNYNGTNHLSTSECSGSSCYFNITIDIPLVTTTAGSQLKNFNWNLTLFDGTSSYNLITDFVQQNVSKIYLRKCSTVYTAKALNFSLQEEETRASMGNFSFDGSFNYWLGSGSVKQNHSFTNSTNRVIDVCILPNATYYMDAIIDYEKDNATYVDRTYYFLNHSISGVYQEFVFYLLNSTQSTSFIQLVENQQSQAVEDALIYVYRYYPEINEYKIVQVTKTNEQGKSVGFYKTESVDYKHIIVKSGVTLLETALTKIFPESSPYTLTFRTGSGVEIPYSDLEDDPMVTTTLTFNSTTNVTRFTWISLDSSVNWGRLLVYQQKHDSLDLLICNETLAFPSGVLTCDVSGYDGTFVAYAYISKSPEKFIKSISFIISTGRAIFGNLGILLGWFIILTVCLIFIWNPTAMIVAANIAIIFVSMIGLIEFAPIFIFGIIAVSIIAIIFLKT